MRKGDRRKSELLAEAERQFFQKGYSATSISDILASQHCSKGSFYHHFDSKQSVLTALCAARAAACLERFQTRAKDRPPIERLDLLFACATPISREEESLCALLMPLLDTPEGEEVILALENALRARFLPALEETLSALRAQKQAFYPCAALPALIFDMHICLYRRLLALGAKHMKGDQGALSQVQDALDAARYMLERCLSLPYGSVTILSAPECAETLSRAAQTALTRMNRKGE